MQRGQACPQRAKAARACASRTPRRQNGRRMKKRRKPAQPRMCSHRRCRTRLHQPAGVDQNDARMRLHRDRRCCGSVQTRLHGDELAPHGDRQPRQPQEQQVHCGSARDAKACRSPQMPQWHSSDLRLALDVPQEEDENQRRCCLIRSLAGVEQQAVARGRCRQEQRQVEVQNTARGTQREKQAVSSKQCESYCTEKRTVPVRVRTGPLTFFARKSSNRSASFLSAASEVRFGLMTALKPSAADC